MRKVLAKVFQSINRHKIRTFLVLILVVLVTSRTVKPQLLPDPCCPILSAGLSTIGDLLKTVVGGPLAEIEKIQDEINRYQQEVIWPLEAINRAKQLAGTVAGMVSSIRRTIRMPVNSATLAQPQKLENILLSRNADLVPEVTTDYTAVYLQIPPSTDVPPERRNLMDMNDALAIGAMKRAIQIDALASVELEAVDRIAAALSQAAPGTVPMVEAEASAWLVRSNAYTQWALAELVRVRSAQLALDGAEMKLGVWSTSGTRGDVNQMLQVK